MNSPRISVILPVYNCEKYLSKCLESLMAQTIREIEIIAVNDSSDDGSLAILEKYKVADSRINVITQENGGAGKARNTGLDAAKGEYISFLDADDFFEPNMLEEAYNAAVVHNADFSAYKCDFFEENNEGKYAFNYQKWTLRTEHLPPYAPFCYRQFTSNVFRVFVGWAWDKLFKHEFIRKNNIRFQEQRTTNDLLFVFSAIVLAKRIVVVPKILIHQRRNLNDSLSKTREKSWDNFYKALIALREVLRNNCIYNELEKDYINYAFHFCLWNYKTLEESTQKLLGEALRNGWFKELGIDNKPESYFLGTNSKNDYLLYKRIIE